MTGKPSIRGIIGVAAVALVLVAIVFIYLLYAAGWGKSEPTFFTGGETSTFVCYMEKTSKDPTITIKFIDGGYRALVQSRGEEALLEFVGGGLATDHYRAGDVKLTIDPEVRIDGMKSGARGPCQQE